VDRKNLSRWEIKNADAGEVTAVIATFDVVDSDGDVTRRGAFPEGAEIPISAYGHTSWGGALPVGKGVVTNTATEAVFTGRFFLDTTAGRDTFNVVKQLGELGQWSYGYDPDVHSKGEVDGRPVRVLEKLKIYEASPVLLGAGVNTRTLGTKAPLRFADEAAYVAAEVRALIDRAADIVAMRQEKGKDLGSESRQLLTALEGELKRLVALLAEPAQEPQGPAADLRAELERQHLRFLSHLLDT